MKPLKIAMLSSVSVHAPNYIWPLTEHESFEWVAMSCTEEVEKALYLRDGKSIIPQTVKMYRDSEELLRAHPELDAVLIGGSNDQTYELFLLCVKYGIKNILTMKAPNFFEEEYAHMQQLAHDNDMVVQVELEMRFKQTIRHLKKLCDDGTIGKVLSITINNTTVVVPPKFMPWVTDPAKSYGRMVPLREGDLRGRGGCLTDHPHAFDLVRFFTDSEFDTIYAQVSPAIRPNATIEEGVFVLGKMQNGVIINIDPSYSRHENKNLPLTSEGPGWEGYPKIVEVDVVINGEKGSILADCFHSGVFYTGKPYNTYAFHYADGSAHYFPSLDEFASAIREHRKPLVNFDLHKNTMRAVNACYESISTGEVIKL